MSPGVVVTSGRLRAAPASLCFPRRVRAAQVFYFLCAAAVLSVLLCCACCIHRRRKQHAAVTSLIKRKGKPTHKQRFVLDKRAPHDGARAAGPKLTAQQAAALHRELAAEQMAGFVMLGGAVRDARVEALAGHALLLCEANGCADELLRRAVRAEVLAGREHCVRV